MADLVSGARVPGVSSSNDLRKLGQIVQRLSRVRFRHVPYFRGYVTCRTSGKVRELLVFAPHWPLGSEIARGQQRREWKLFLAG